MGSDIIIIAGGPSVSTMPCHELENYGHVIGVNESAYLLPCHEALSMDRLWMEARYKFLKEKKVRTHFRMCAWRHDAAEWPELSLFVGDVNANCLNENTGFLNGKNSGQCAINLAYQRRPDRIFLFGFDMHGSYFYKTDDLVSEKKKITNKAVSGKCNIRNEWFDFYPVAAKQLAKSGIKVYNVSTESKVEQFEKISWVQFKKLME